MAVAGHVDIITMDDSALANMMSKTSIDDPAINTRPGKLKCSVTGYGREVYFIFKPRYEVSRLFSAYRGAKGIDVGRLRLWLVRDGDRQVEIHDGTEMFAQVSDGGVLRATLVS